MVVNERLDIGKKMENIERSVAESSGSAAEVLKRRENSTPAQDKEIQWLSDVKKNQFPPLIIKPKQANRKFVNSKKKTLGISIYYVVG